MARLRSPNRPAGPATFSQWDLWRLSSLVLGVVMVGFLIRELNRPQVAVGLDRAVAVAAEAEPSAVQPPAAVSPADPAQFRQLLALAGWDAARFATIGNEGPISNEDHAELAELLWRLKTFDGAQLAAWTEAGPTIRELVDAPSEHLGALVALSGRVTKVERLVLPAELATRLEMPAYFECRLKLADDAGIAMILASRVPKAWLELESVDEPAAAAGVFIKPLPSENESFEGLFVAREIAWYPKQPRPPLVSLGKSVLGELGVDVGLLDHLRQRKSITGSERETFYQVLDAAGRIGTNQLTRFAEQDLASIQNRWAEDEERLAAALKSAPQDANTRDRMRLQLAREVQERAAKGQYSVAPLFNDAENQVGELVMLGGTARRVTRIDVGKSPDGAISDVARRFGIDHYYEIDVFTDDSQNNPIAYIARELPPGMPIGDGLHEPVRIAGFFLKSWSFESRRAILPTAPDGTPTAAGPRQFAPLVIGRSPHRLEPPDPTADAYASYFAAALFLMLLGAVWATAWWFARDGRRFAASTLANRFSLPDGESLNELDLDHSPSPRENE